MNTRPARPLAGIVATLEDLIAARPDGTAGGFAPGGRVRTHQIGTYRSTHQGRGMEFDEARIYQPGDDIRTIDWRVTARTGKVHTKLFQEERERPVLILADVRTAMQFGTRTCFKSVLTAEAAAVLTWVALAGSDRVGGVVLSPLRVLQHRPQRSRARILAFIRDLAEATADGLDAEGEPVPLTAPEPTLAEGLARLRLTARPGTLAFVISDFHDLDAVAAKELGRLGQTAHVTNIFVHDRLEAELPAAGRYPVSDGTAVAMIDADSRAVRHTHAARFAAQRAAIEDLSRQRGMNFLPLETGTRPGELLHPERLVRARPAGRAAAGERAA